MQQRKLIKLGNSSFAIALPKAWVEKSGLKKGEDVFLEENGEGEIILTSSFKAKGNETQTTINIEGKIAEEIARDMIAAYTGGYKIIKIVGSPEFKNLAKEISKSFLNLELIDETAKEATFKDLLDLEIINIENFIKRMDNNIREMFSILFKSIQNNQTAKNISKELEGIDKDITKFYFLIWRLMNLGINNPTLQHSLKINSKSLLFYFWISQNLEQVGDELKRMSRMIGTISKDPFFERVLNITFDRYSNSMKAFYDKNKSLAKESLLQKSESIKMCDKLSAIEGFSAIAEKMKTINANVHNNSKLVFYDL